MNRKGTNWTRRRGADRPSKRKKRDLDEQNAIAADIILAAPERQSQFQVDWARRFTRRQASESSGLE